MASCRRFWVVMLTTAASFSSRLEVATASRACSSSRVRSFTMRSKQDRGLEQVIGVAVQVEPVLHPLHQGAVDLGQLRDLGAQLA